MSRSEPRNPFYLLLLFASLLFVITALAYTLVPTLEEKARERGQAPPPSEFRAALRQDGWQWLLYELAAMMVFGLSSMGLDRLRTLKKERPAATIPPSAQDFPAAGSPSDQPCPPSQNALKSSGA